MKDVSRKLFMLLSVALYAVLPGRGQGLKFQGAEVPIDRRTSYEVFEERSMHFGDHLEIAFDMRLYPVEDIGYVLHIRSEEGAPIYNLFYDGRGGDLFSLNEEGRSTLLQARINKRELIDARWFGMRLRLDFRNDSISLAVDGRPLAAVRAELPRRYTATSICFGRSEHQIDVPTFAMRNLRITGDGDHAFPLEQHTGEVVYDDRGRPQGRVRNPEWLINDAYFWRYCTSFHSIRVAGASYNPHTKEVYYYNRDTLFRYNIRTGATSVSRFANPCPVRLVLGMNFLDGAGGRLYTYEVYDEASEPDAPSVASLDLNDLTWRVESTGRLPSQRHHHGGWFDPDARRYTIFGGFGDMRYSNEFDAYLLDSGRWESPSAAFVPRGDTICPRYFSSVGCSDDRRWLYIYGGMGNETGEQALGRFYLYDLYRVDLQNGRTRRCWQIPWDERLNSVAVRNMVIDDDNRHFYTFCYPESVSNSFLRLFRFSIDDGSHEILGDSIPIRSDKIATNANLYFDRNEGELIALVQVFDDDIRSCLDVYRLAFPPITAERLAASTPAGGSGTGGGTLLAVAVAAVVTGVAVWRYGRRRKAARRSESGEAVAVAASVPSLADGGDERPNSIRLFGDFTVYDRHGRDISYMVTARQRQLFCIVLQHSLREGVTSQRINSLLWPDKAEDKVKNSRGVTINHLRKTLGELDGIGLRYAKGFFRLEPGEGFYCDYLRCMELIARAAPDGTDRRADRDDLGELLRIVARGKFLNREDHPLFDGFKEEVESQLDPYLQRELAAALSDEDYPAVVEIAEAIFHVDPLNDNALGGLIRALQGLKRPDEALVRYHAFVVEYRRVFGREYPRPFREC